MGILLVSKILGSANIFTLSLENTDAVPPISQFSNLYCARYGENTVCTSHGVDSEGKQIIAGNRNKLFDLKIVQIITSWLETLWDRLGESSLKILV
jgi:hypothetical protein